MVETLADMKASSLAMVMMSRTMGSPWRVTGSAVSNVAAMMAERNFLRR